MLKECGGGLEPTESWSQNVLKSMNWTKQKKYRWKIITFKEVPRGRKIYFPKKNFQRHIGS